ncbi:hypothetical protein PAAG_00300 [Paracoccidioides lutzii Pb01]|uniref:Uncharacterized protein n=1 Tax=Paracoccidioides lutzii (strain ATCC MYA-826 / Pb01) TaxID=502779 RepID=C1GP55_PARBA|nr:hypothetical protein PAAG_00300 [Paracoccidioides lutzii Pb01]EEH35977.2 hypothetical protein PAAG_00300 [Paracoccidioides lutzii Pb01]
MALAKTNFNNDGRHMRANEPAAAHSGRSPSAPSTAHTHQISLLTAFSTRHERSPNASRSLVG